MHAKDSDRLIKVAKNRTLTFPHPDWMMWQDSRMPLAFKSVSMIFDNLCRVKNDPYRAERLACMGRCIKRTRPVG